MEDKMDRRTFLGMLSAIPVLVGVASDSGSMDFQMIMLPEPEKDGGKTILAALQERRTIRNISPEKLPLQVLYNLLWAAIARAIISF